MTTDFEIIEAEDINHGYTDVEIATVGEFVGSDKDGNPIEQNITQTSLDKIAEESVGKEYLLDQQHASLKNGLDRDDRAAGWITKLWTKAGSLFGRVFWTKLGRDLIDSKILRFVSPVFKLNDKHEPESLINVALVNTPAIKGMAPVLNQEPEDLLIKEKDILDMSKEELKELIKETIAEIKVDSEEDKEIIENNDIIEDNKDDVVENCDKTTEPETVVDACSDEELVKNEDVVDEKDEKDEVIKIESLNHSVEPTLNEEPEWKKLHGKDFIDYVKSGKLNKYL